MTEYQHGGDVKSFALDCQCNPAEIIDLSSNINFVKPKVNLDISKINLASYPDYQGIYDKLAAFYGVNVNQLELFNGANSAIFSILKSLEFETVSIFSPAYLEYKRAALIFGAKLELIDRFSNSKVKPGPKGLIVLVNPATPDGLYYDLEESLMTFAKAGATILIDESFLEFSQKPSGSKYLADYPKLYIIKSLSKYWAAAGVRLGAVISHAKNIKELKKTEPLWKLSALDVAYMEAALTDKGFFKRSHRANREAKDEMLKILNKSSYVKTIYPSDVNYFLLELNIRASEFQEILKPYKILVRSCENFDFLGLNHVRIAVKDLGILQILKKAICA